MGDVVLVGRYANDLEAQAAAAALRNAGLHPVVLGRDPLAQLFQPFHAARLLVPEAEREAARELLEPPGPEEVGGNLLLDEDAGGRALRRRRLGLVAAFWVLLLAALAAPGWVFVPLLAVLAAFALLRRG